MARCKLTSMNLRTIRKSREYQALLIDLVAMGVVGKSAAEETLGYTIPAGLLSGTAKPNDDEEEIGGEGGNEPDNKVTLLYLDTSRWVTEEYTLQENTTAQDIITVAKSLFGDDTLDAIFVVEANPEYEEGESDLIYKYIPVDPQPEVIEPGMLIAVRTTKPNDVEG